MWLKKPIGRREQVRPSRARWPSYNVGNQKVTPLLPGAPQLQGHNRPRPINWNIQKRHTNYRQQKATKILGEATDLQFLPDLNGRKKTPHHRRLLETTSITTRRLLKGELCVIIPSISQTYNHKGSKRRPELHWSYPMDQKQQGRWNLPQEHPAKQFKFRWSQLSLSSCNQFIIVKGFQILVPKAAKRELLQLHH